MRLFSHYTCSPSTICSNLHHEFSASMQAASLFKSPPRADRKRRTLVANCRIQTAGTSQPLHGVSFHPLTICCGDNASKHEFHIGDTRRGTEDTRRGTEEATRYTLRNGDGHCGTSISRGRIRGCDGDLL